MTSKHHTQHTHTRINGGTLLLLSLLSSDFACFFRSTLCVIEYDTVILLLPHISTLYTVWFKMNKHQNELNSIEWCALFVQTIRNDETQFFKRCFVCFECEAVVRFSGRKLHFCTLIRPFLHQFWAYFIILDLSPLLINKILNWIYLQMVIIYWIAEIILSNCNIKFIWIDSGSYTSYWLTARPSQESALQFENKYSLTLNAHLFKVRTKFWGYFLQFHTTWVIARLTTLSCPLKDDLWWKQKNLIFFENIQEKTPAKSVQLQLNFVENTSDSPSLDVVVKFAYLCFKTFRMTPGSFNSETDDFPILWMHLASPSWLQLIISWAHLSNSIVKRMI